MTEVGKHILAVKLQASKEMHDFGEVEGDDGIQQIALLLTAEFVDLLVDQYGWSEGEVMETVKEIRERGEKTETKELLQ